MSCSLYKIIVEYGKFDISNPLLSINHTPRKLLDILKITPQLDNGDKLIVLYRKDILKAKQYIIKQENNNNPEYNYDYIQHMDYILESLDNKEFNIYYVDGI